MVSQFFTVSFVITTAFAIASVNCNSEVDILKEWKNSLVDPNNALQNWDTTLVTPCTWDHILCDDQNSAMRIAIENAGLSGPLVPQLGNLVSLQHLQLSGNNINGHIPEEIGKLRRLVSFGLSNNNLSGVLPSSFGNLTSLRLLLVANNSLSGPIPASLGNLRSLQEIDLSSNKFSGDIPVEILSLDLKILNVSNNLLSISASGTVRGAKHFTFVIYFICCLISYIICLV